MDDYVIDGDLAFTNTRAALEFYREQYHKKKEWVGLTDEEMFDCLVQADGEAKRLPLGFKWFAEAIEAKLKEKNAA